MMGACWVIILKILNNEFLKKFMIFDRKSVYCNNKLCILPFIPSRFLFDCICLVDFFYVMVEVQVYIPSVRK